MNEEEINPFEKEVFDPDDIKGLDIKLNPDFFIHIALTTAIKALNKENLKESMIQYRMLVETAEAIAKGRGYIDEKYNEELDKFKKTLGDSTDLIAMGKLSIKKFELITRAFSDRQQRTDKLIA